MKSFLLVIASLFLLSSVWAGGYGSASPAAYALAAGKNTKTPGAKATEKAGVKTPKGKEPGKGRKLTFSGEAVEAGSGSLTIKTDAGGETTFLVTADTSIEIPTLGKNATLADLNLGVRVLVRASAGDDGTFTALQIRVVPGKPDEKHHVGIVVDYQPDVSIAIRASDGTEQSFLITADTKILPVERADELAVGRLVTIISRRDVTGGPFTAQGIVVHPLPGAESLTPSATATKTPTPTETPTATSTPTPEPTATETYTPSATTG
jgi:hypothetical protein